MRYGIWTHSDGGFISDNDMSEREAHAELNRLIEEDPDNREDMTIEAMCLYHPGQRYHTCESCERKTESP